MAKSSPFRCLIIRRLRNAKSRINTAFFTSKKQITPHWIWYNRVARNYKPFTQERSYSDIMIPHKQLSLADIFEDCQNIFEEDKPQFLSLLERHIDIDEIIPATFYSHFYASTGRTRKYSLYALLWALIIQCIFSIPTDQLLLTFLFITKTL